MQVELAHHYQESVKCREKIASVSRMDQEPALMEPAHSHSLGGEFHCLPCNYSSKVSQHYQKHLKSQRHQRSVAESRAVLTTDSAVAGVMVAKQSVVKVEEAFKVEEPSSTGLYQCLPCEYAGKDLKNYTKHLKTQKHKKSVMEERFQLGGEEDRVTLAREARGKQGERVPTITASGRKVIPKRFIGDEDDEPGVKQSHSGKRKKIECGGGSPVLPSVSRRGKVKEKEDAMADDQEVGGAPLRQWSCEFCSILSSSPKELFTHMGRSTNGSIPCQISTIIFSVMHVPLEVLDCAGLQPDQGW